MKLGVVLPQTEIGDDPSVLRTYIETAESLGYDYVLCYDHVLGANPDRPGGWNGPYTHESMFHEPFVTYGWMAGFTKHIEFVTGILILPQRQTALVAKQAAQLDHLSNGRLRLGIGVGWNAVEYEALNEDFSVRGRRSAEQVQLLRELWTKRLVTFEGEFHTINDAGVYPMPVQQPIPLWFGGGADAVLRRMAVMGDGWMPNTMSLEKLKPVHETILGYLDEAGREPESFGLDIRINIFRYEENEWTGLLQEWRDYGVTHACINTMGFGLEGAAHIDAIRRFHEIVHG